MLVCGAFRVDDDALLAGLPPVIHTHELASDAGSWLAHTAKLLAKRDWSGATLAARVGMSRSAFAERFADVVGVTPVQYLIQWRMQKAATLLRGSDDGISDVGCVVL